MTQRAATIHTLPPEIHHEISQLLCPADRLRPSVVDVYFQLSTAPLNHQELLDANFSFVSCRACKDCLRLRPVVAFSPDMLSSSRDVGGADAAQRFCVGCGVKNCYTGFLVGNHIAAPCHNVICTDCDAFPAAEENDSRKSNSLCPDCFQKCQSHGTYQQTTQRSASKSMHRLYCLGDECEVMFWNCPHVEASRGTHLDPSSGWTCKSNTQKAEGICAVGPY